MPTLSEMNESVAKVDPNGYEQLLVNQVRSQLTKENPTPIHVGKELFYWLSETVNPTPTNGTFDGKLRFYTDNLDRCVDVHLDYHKKD